MLKRIIIAILVLPFLGFLIFFQNSYPILIAGIISFLIALFEIFLMFEKKGINIFKKTGILFALIIFLIALFKLDTIYILYAVISMLFFLFLTLIFTKNVKNLEGIFYTLSSVLYICFFGMFVIKLRFLPDGIYFLFLLPLLTWVYDAGAYFTGKFFGKTKLIPELSPGKTVEGLLGGIIINIIVAVIIKFTVLPSFFGILHAIILPIITSLSGQAGDITASIFKRFAGVKNSSSLLSEHGGFLDKLDSILFNAPVIYFYIIIFII